MAAENKTKSPAQGARIENVPTVNNDLTGILKSESQRAVEHLVRQNPARAQETVEKIIADNNKTKVIGNEVGFGKSLSKFGSGLGAITDFASGFVNRESDSAFDTQQQVGNALMQINPIVGGAYKALSFAGEISGMNSSFLNKNQTNAVGMSNLERIGNNILSVLPFAGIAGKVQKADVITDNMRMSQSAYNDTYSDLQTASSMGGKRYAIGSDEIDDFMSETKSKGRRIDSMVEKNNRLVSSVPHQAQNIMNQSKNIYSASNPYIGVGKEGMKLISVDEVRQILKANKSVIPAFQNGGVIGIDTNVIGEGKYHAHLNHLEEVSPELEVLTKKGIPVISAEEGGEITQIAEIERKELILRLEVTQKLEKLAKDGSEEAMIEAGKLLATEICENTQDNTGEMLNDGTEKD